MLSETYDLNDRLFQRLQSRLNAAERTFRRCLQDHLKRPSDGKNGRGSSRPDEQAKCLSR